MTTNAAQAELSPAANTSKEPILVAIDDGYAQTKLYTLDANGEPISIAVRSSARSGRYGLGSLSGEALIGCYETEEGEAFTCSNAIEAENTQFDGFHTSSMNRVLVNHALIVGGFSGMDVDLIVGLPVADFYLDDGKDEAKIAEKIANLRKSVTPVSDKTPVANMCDIQIGCQAVAAFIDHALSDDLQERVPLNSTVAIVDIGGRTTDIAVVVNGSSIDRARSGTANLGVLDVYKGVQGAVRSKFKVKDTLPLDQLDRAVRTGRVSLWNEEHDISDDVAGIITEHEAAIAREVDRRIGSAANIQQVLFVGGGSALFQGIANHFRNGVKHDSPEFANARGLHKFMRYKAQG